VATFEGTEGRIAEQKIYQNFTQGAEVGFVVIHDIFGFDLRELSFSPLIAA
jgi:hypothetical protein